MNIKNYTSGVESQKTIARIEAKIASIGATGIMKSYDTKGQVSAIVFQIAMGAKLYTIKVPANVNACHEALWKDYCINHTRPRSEAKERLLDQAHRTAWRLVQDWIEVQVSMIVMKQAEWREVFMPYLWGSSCAFSLRKILCLHSCLLFSVASLRSRNCQHWT